MHFPVALFQTVSIDFTSSVSFASMVSTPFNRPLVAGDESYEAIINVFVDQTFAAMTEIYTGKLLDTICVCVYLGLCHHITSIFTRFHRYNYKDNCLVLWR